MAAEERTDPEFVDALRLGIDRLPGYAAWCAFRWGGMRRSSGWIRPQRAGTGQPATGGRLQKVPVAEG